MDFIVDYSFLAYFTTILVDLFFNYSITIKGQVIIEHTDTFLTLNNFTTTKTYYENRK